MLDEERVERDPVLAGEHEAESGLGLLGSFRAHHPESIRNAMDVGVDGDPRDVVPEHQHAVGGLWADPRERHELLQRAGHLPRVAGEELAGARPDQPCLGVVEPGFVDQRLDRLRPRPCEGGRVGVAREQSRARGRGGGIAGALGQDRSDQHLERVLGVVPEVRDPPVARVVEPRESVEDRHPVVRTARRHRTDRLRPEAVAGGGVSPARRGSCPGSERSGSSFPPCASRSSSPTR